MNEDTGFVVCPNCKMPWSGGYACAYCYSTEKPPAYRVAGPGWAWALAAAVIFLIWAIDYTYGGHGWQLIKGWLK